MADFLMPSLGADMEAATLVKWRVEPGTRIARGDIVAEVVTDKGVIEIECFEPGIVEELLAPRPVDDREIGLFIARAELQEEIERLVERLVRSRARTVDLVEDDDRAEPQPERPHQHVTGLGHGPFVRVHQQQHRIHHGI